MAYGIVVENLSGHKIIQDQQPIFALKRSGTLSQYQTTNVGTAPYTAQGYPHLYGYLVTGSNAEPVGDEEFFIKLEVGEWVSYHPWQLFISDGQSNAYTTLALSQLTSNRSSNLPYYVFDRMNNISGAGSSTGYGAQVFNASGSCMWDSNEITNRVSQGVTATGGTTVNVTSTANAVSLRSWYLKITGGGGAIGRNGYTLVKNWYAKRVSTTSWEIAVGDIDYGFYPYQGAWYNFSSPTTLLTGDAKVLLAYT